MGILGGSRSKTGDPGVLYHIKMGDPLRLLSPYIILKGRDRNNGRVFEHARQDVHI